MLFDSFPIQNTSSQQAQGIDYETINTPCGKGVKINPHNIRTNTSLGIDTQNLKWSNFCTLITRYGFQHLTKIKDSDVYKDNITGLILVAKLDNSTSCDPILDYAYVCGEAYGENWDLAYTRVYGTNKDNPTPFFLYVSMDFKSTMHNLYKSLIFFPTWRNTEFFKRLDPEIIGQIIQIPNQFSIEGALNTALPLLTEEDFRRVRDAMPNPKEPLTL